MICRTDNAIHVGAPPRFVWDMTRDVRGWPELFTEYASIEVLWEDATTQRFRLTMVPDPDGTVWSWVSERTVDEDNLTSSAHRVETGPFVYMRISWAFTDDDGGTLMRWRQEFEPKPDAPFTEESITKRINDNSAIQMAIIRDKVEAAAKKADTHL